MKSVQVTLKSLSPILMHAYPLVPIEALDKKTPAEQAELAAYRDPATTMLYVPGVAIQRALVNAAVFSKGKGRGSLQKVTAASVIVSPERVSMGISKYAVDSRPVVVPATKGRVLRHRPRVDDWKITFEIEWDETLMTETQVRRIVDDMGKRVGLLDFRPERKGSFGRCVVIAWHLLGVESSAKVPASV